MAGSVVRNDRQKYPWYVVCPAPTYGGYLPAFSAVARSEGIYGPVRSRRSAAVIGNP